MPKKIKTARYQSADLERLKERQRQAEFDKTRPNANARGYNTARWQRLRRMVLNRDPICVADGCTQPATDVDHIKPRSRGGRDALYNLQGLCHRCHSRKTAVEDSKFARRKRNNKQVVADAPTPAALPPLLQHEQSQSNPGNPTE